MRLPSDLPRLRGLVLAVGSLAQEALEVLGDRVARGHVPRIDLGLIGLLGLEPANELLDLEAYPDYAPMGMQVPGAREVRRIVAGVSASL